MQEILPKCSGWMHLPETMLGSDEAIENLIADLTFIPKFSEDKQPVFLYDQNPPNGYFGVPRAYGLEAISGQRFYDQRCDGESMQPVAKMPNPDHPNVLEPEAQARFMEDLYVAAREHNHFLADAPTGSGKTVCALHMAARLGRKTVVLVHQKMILRQWQGAITQHLGIPPERVGIVVGKRCDYKDKDFVLCMMQSLTRRVYDPEFYQSFGVAIYDEVHRVGAPLLSQTGYKFPARVRLGLSATIEERNDGGERSFYWHLGPVRVRSAAMAMPLDLYVMRFTSRMPEIKAKKHGGRVMMLQRDAERNARIVDIIVRLHRAGRQTLILSDSVLHLQYLMLMCNSAGIPNESMGQFTGHIKHGSRKVTQRPEVLDHVKETAQNIFATYVMMGEAQDIPRLDAGIDATPRSKATQYLGRVRRPLPGKLKPIWVTVLDTRWHWAAGYFKKRCEAYHRTGVRVIDGKL